MDQIIDQIYDNKCDHEFNFHPILIFLGHRYTANIYWQMQVFTGQILLQATLIPATIFDL